MYKPLLLEYENNKYIQYDFNKFNVEHILSDDDQKDIRYCLGNLLLCPDDINEKMKDKAYVQKRQYLLSSGIPYLKAFGEKYEDFDERNIEIRTNEVVEKLRKLYLISIENVNERYSKLQMYFDLKSQLVIAFGEDSRYVEELKDKGIDKFIEYIYKNGTLPSNDTEKIKKYLKSAS